MNLPTETFGNVIVVHSPEELGADQAEEFESFMRCLSLAQIVLDMDRTETLDSGGLEALLDVHDMLLERGGDMKIATGNAMNRKILEITRLDQQLEVFESVLDAVKSYRT